MVEQELYELLEFYSDKYNQQQFIQEDPISIPHQFNRQQDIEVIGFIIATISWGNRKSILKNGQNLIHIMGHSPFDYVMNASVHDLADLNFVHRTFNSVDLSFFILGLRRLLQDSSTLETYFNTPGGMREKISHFRKAFLNIPHEQRSEKHISNPMTGSAAKRINMFLRWMVREDNKGVDFGLWKQIKPAELYIPLDVHTGTVARKLELIERKANDWKALEELMLRLRKFDSNDPVKYDFALFGIGVNKEF
jgi:uncharacterized protein (TIGR02757 family)